MGGHQSHLQSQEKSPQGGAESDLSLSEALEAP